MFKGIKYIPKVPVTDKHSLSVIYTPGVAFACEKIKEKPETSYDYTNRENTVGVFAFNYEEALKRAIFLKTALSIDAIPFEISSKNPNDIKFVVENLEPCLGAVDLSLIRNIVENKTFNVSIPVLIAPAVDLKEFFLCVSKTIFLKDISKIPGNIEEQSLILRQTAGGSLESELTEEEHVKPVGIITEGSAVLGLGNIGAAAGLPVMEGKAVLFASSADISAVPICVKTQNPEAFIKTVLLIKNSFSAVNLEDIAAPNCFEIERKLREQSDIPIFHDDAHGTSIVVTAGLLNALKIVGKDISKVKIVMSGAGAAGYTIAKLLLKAGAADIVVCDRNGAIVSGRTYEKPNHAELSEITNPYRETGVLKEVIKNADVFIGVSAPGLLSAENIRTMAEKSVVFALANPVPEIIPTEAVKGGAVVVASGRSDFPNQINNCCAFPGVFKGLLKYKTKQVSEDMKLACAKALAGVVTPDKLSANYIIPDALDKSVPITIAEVFKNFVD